MRRREGGWGALGKRSTGHKDPPIGEERLLCVCARVRHFAFGAAVRRPFPRAASPGAANLEPARG